MEEEEEELGVRKATFCHVRIVRADSPDGHGIRTIIQTRFYLSPPLCFRFFKKNLCKLFAHILLLFLPSAYTQE